MQSPFRILGESDSRPDSFHDCHVHGLRWKADRFTFTIDLQYIVEWVQPIDPSRGYRFWISEARLTFRDVDDLKLSMDWSGTSLDAQMETIRVLKSRATPAGLSQRNYEVVFSTPEGSISLWSTGYELALLEKPLLSEVSSIVP